MDQLNSFEKSMDFVEEWMKTATQFVVQNRYHLDKALYSDHSDLIKSSVLEKYIEPIAPSEGTNLEKLLNIVQDTLQYGYNPLFNGYFAFVNGGGLIEPAIADFVTESLYRYSGYTNVSCYLSKFIVLIIFSVCTWIGTTGIKYNSLDM